MANPLNMRQIAQAIIQQRGVMPGTRHAPFSDEEDIAYGFPGQGDAYDNPDNPNYYLDDVAQGGADEPDAPGAIDEPDAAYQPGRSSFMAGPGAAQDAIRKISEAIGLGQERPIWGQDYLGPQTGGEMDAVSYQATPYEQGRSMPPEMAGQLEGGDQELQDLTGLDPYGNPLPPSWAQRVPKR
jgi:hypothetical protein